MPGKYTKEERLQRWQLFESGFKRCFDEGCHVKPVAEFGRDRRALDGLNGLCKQCVNERSRSWHAALSPEDRRLARRKDKLREHYRMTLPGFLAMLDRQGGRCAICGSDNGERELCVDHDHACCPGRNSCGRCVRGLLCDGCNHGVGKFSDSAVRLRAAAAYLDSHRAAIDAAPDS